MPDLLNKHLFLFLIVIVGYFFLNLSVLTNDPPVWPDEAAFADVAHNFLTEAKFATHLWRDAYPGVENHTFWSPPIYIWLLAMWQKFWGTSIVAQRTLSISIGLGVLLLIFILSQQLIGSKKTGWLFLPLLSLLLDKNFLVSTRFGRPEILMFAFGIGAQIIYLYLQKNKLSERKAFLFLLAGFFCGLAFLTHFLGIFFWLTLMFHHALQQKTLTVKQKGWYLLSAGFVMPISLWLLTVLPDADLAIAQIELAALRKNLDTAWISLVLNSAPAVTLTDWIRFSSFNFLRLAFMLYVVISILILIVALRIKKPGLNFTAQALLLAWAMTTLGKMQWYLPLLLPYFYLGVAQILASLPSFFPTRKLLLLLFGLLFITNSHLTLDLILSKGFSSPYFAYSEALISVVPAHSSVFLSAIPDPYHALVTSPKNFYLYQFPALITSWEKYRSILDNSDYVVYNGRYHPGIYGNLLEKYLELNQISFSQINIGEGYRAHVIKLQPREIRIDPAPTAD